MDQTFDTHAVYRKLQDSDVPERQADAIVEVMSDTMGNLVTNEKLTAELDLRFGKGKEDFIQLKGGFVSLKESLIELKSEMNERFTKLEAKLETDIAKSQRLMIATILGSSLTIVAMQFATLLVFLRPLLGE